MAQKTITSLIDDLDGSEAEETVRFGLDGTSYEIDLNSKNAAALRKAFDRYLKVARRAGPSRGSGRSSRSVDPRAVRAWAEQNGVKVSSRGRIPGDVIEQYKASARR